MVANSLAKTARAARRMTQRTLSARLKRLQDQRSNARTDVERERLDKQIADVRRQIGDLKN